MARRAIDDQVPDAKPVWGSGKGETTTLTLKKVRLILDCFLPDNSPLTLTAIQQKTSLPTTTVFRLLQSLVNEGFLTNEGGYRISWTIGRWISAVYDNTSLVHVALPMMGELRDETEESASLLVREGMKRVCVAVKLSRLPVNMQSQVGNTLPLQAGASSKILLAWDELALKRVLERGLIRFTPTTQTDEASYLAELEAVRQRGYALSRSEVSDGVASISAPVFDPYGTIAAALNLGIPIQRASDEYVAARIDAVVRTAERITSQLKGDRRSEPAGSSSRTVSKRRR